MHALPPGRPVRDHGLISLDVIELSSGLYATLKSVVVTPLVPPEPEPPPPLPPPELLLDDEAAALRSIFPITLKVTVNASLFGLLNFNVRAAEDSFGVRALSRPSFGL